MWDSQDPDLKMVIRKRYALLLGRIMLLGAPLLLAFLLYKIATGEGEIGAAVLILVVPILAFVGIWLAGLTTTVTFNNHTDSMTVTRGHVPLFLWWQRTKNISRETARTVRVTSKEWAEATEYRVVVITKSGKTLFLFRDGTPNDANRLENRIRQWAGLEC